MQDQGYTPVYELIYRVVRQIPAGKVATYGQVASMVGNCTARMVGYAMAALEDESGVPSSYFITAQGKISPRGSQLSTEVQRLRLEDEGVRFEPDGKVSWADVRWHGPPLERLQDNGLSPTPSWLEEWAGRGNDNPAQPPLFG